MMRDIGRISGLNDPTNDLDFPPLAGRLPV
jgi:hypothetical protein